MMADNNVNIVHVSAVEGLAGQIGEHINQLKEENARQSKAKYEALDILASFETNQILELRRQYE